jgi:hypothetical protein
LSDVAQRHALLHGRAQPFAERLKRFVPLENQLVQSDGMYF